MMKKSFNTEDISKFATSVIGLINDSFHRSNLICGEALEQVIDTIIKGTGLDAK